MSVWSTFGQSTENLYLTTTGGANEPFVCRTLRVWFTEANLPIRFFLLTDVFLVPDLPPRLCGLPVPCARTHRSGRKSGAK